MLTDTMYLEFVEHPKMSAIRSRTVWVHVDVPGQGQDAPDLPTESVAFFPQLIVHWFLLYIHHHATMYSESFNI